MTAALVSCLGKAFPDADVRVTSDDSVLDGAAVRVEVVSSVFAGLNKVKRHQKIYKYLQPFIQSGELHAVGIVALTPEEK